MNKKLVSVFLLSIFLSVSTFISLHAQGNFKEGIVRVKVEERLQSAFANSKILKSGGVKTGVVAFDNLSNQMSVTNMKRVFRYSPKHEARHQKHDLHLWYEIQYNANEVTPMQVAQEYGRLAEIAVAEPIQKVSYGNVTKGQTYTAAQLAQSNFNDLKLKDQWHYNNDGTAHQEAVAGADINLYEAWEIETGSKDVIVAIIDGGVDTDHNDLKKALWVNEAELNGVAGEDSDGNGYVDDIYGYNFAMNTSEVSAQYHGTHVAGTVGAVNNNGLGVAGVAGGDDGTGGVRLMSCQIFTAEDVTGGMAEALIYAADNGALIAQCSWGWETEDYYEQAVLDAIDYFIEEAGSFAGSKMRGGIAIFAAGNSGLETREYPAAYEKTIAVGATSVDFTKASYSNYGDHLDISAPGGDDRISVLSTYPNNTYQELSGTSMAAPHVAGVAALVISKYGGNDFTPDMLQLHLLSSVQDLAPHLEDAYQNKMGSGLIDAAMALESSEDGAAPSAVNDLNIQTNQSEALLEWTGVTNDLGKIAESYIIYWSDASFNTDTYAEVNSIVINTKFSELNEVFDYTLTGLSSNTEYWFAIKAFDRWGNGSDLSTIQNVKTNNGPALNVLFNEALTRTLNTSNSFLHTETFSLNNEDEGLLRWSSFIGLSDFTISTSSEESTVAHERVVISPTINNYSFNKLVVPQYTVVASPVQLTQEEDKITYGSSSASMYIGETDTALCNSSATRFYVESAFTADAIWVPLHFTEESGEVVIEIYKGAQIAEAVLVTKQNLTSLYDEQYTYLVEFEEQVLLEEGDYVWFVVHVPSGNLYPLGIGEPTDEEGIYNCLYSSDNGQNWDFLSDIYPDEDNLWVWSLIVRNASTTLPEHVSLSPSMGSEEGMSSVDIQLDIDANSLLNGHYVENIVFSSNDDNNRLVKKKLEFTVEGHLPILKSQNIIDFGSVVYGKSQTYEIELTNLGYGTQLLKKREIQVSGNADQFQIEAISGDITGQTTGSITITYEPEGTGQTSYVATFTIGDYSFTTIGNALDPAIIELTPAEASLGTGLTIGNTPYDTQNETMAFEIANTGKYPLTYSVVQYADDYEIPGLDIPYSTSGYIYNAIVNEDISVADIADIPDVDAHTEEVTSILQTSEYAVEIDLGFSFPFYDSLYNKVWIHEQGLLAFGDEVDVNRSLNNQSTTVLSKLVNEDIIAAVLYAADLNHVDARIAYYKGEGIFSARYEKIKFNGSLVNFTITIHQNGDFTIYFDDHGNSMNDLQDYYIGAINGATGDYAFLNCTDYPCGMGQKSIHSLFRFLHPGQNMVTDVINPTGTILASETQQVQLSINTSSAIEGEVSQRVAILSNDPYNPITYFDLSAVFSEGGVPAITLLNDTIALGSVQQTAEKVINVELLNQGTGIAEITDVQFSSGDLTLDSSVSLPIELNTRKTTYLPIAINTAVVKSIDNQQITITLASGDILDVVVDGEVVAIPKISVSPTETDGFTETLQARTQKEVNLNISNTGDGDMSVSIESGSWYYPANLTDGENDNFDYSVEQYSYNRWVEILPEAEETNLYSYFWSDVNKNQYKAIPLNNSISYYGNKYDTLYVAPTGWLSVVEPVNMSTLFDIPFNFPGAGDIWSGVIAPMTGNHTNTSVTIDDETGIFYKEFDDKMVVTFYKFVDLFSFSNLYSFQVVIHQNGIIDFNYDINGFIKSYVVVGYESADELKGQTIYTGTMYTSEAQEFCYSLLPIKSENIPAHSKLDFPIIIDANALNDGDYNGFVKVNNNTVDKPEVSVPVNLTVIGEPELSASELNDTVWYVNNTKTYEYELTVTNTGSKIFEASEVSFEGTAVTVNSEVENTILLKPGESITYYLIYKPESDPVSSTLSSTLTLNIKDLEGNVGLNWQGTFSTSRPPISQMDTDDIYVRALNKEHQESTSVMLSNNGWGQLNYQASIEYNRGANYPEEAKVSTASVATTNALQAIADEEVVVANAESLKSQINTYERTLNYNEQDTPENWLGFGATESFTCATKFVAPSNGFTLSHIETWYRCENKTENTLKVEILVGGSDPASSTVIGQGTLEYSKDSYDSYGEYYTIELDESIFIYPNESFYVIIYYPYGVTNPQGYIANYTDTEEDQFYYYYSEDGWVDFYISSFWYSQLMVKAHEYSYEEKTWITLDAATSSGQLSTGGSANIGLNFNAENAQEMVNNAKLKVTTNDPNQETYSVDLYLLLNDGPVVELTDGLTELEEATTSVLTFEVEDYEGDAFDVELVTEAEWATISKQEGSVIEVTLEPDYFSAGYHTLTFLGVDEHMAESEYTFEVEVINVNQLPYFTNGELMDTTVVLHHGAFTVDFADLISDPDLETLSYSYKLSRNDLVDIHESSTSAVITPYNIGSLEVTISASDSENESLVGTYNMLIKNRIGIDDVLLNHQVLVYPTLTKDVVNVKWTGLSSHSVAMRLINSVGQILEQHKVDISADGIQTFNLSNMPAGVYFIEWVADDVIETYKVVLQ